MGQLGLVELSVELRDRTINVEVSPVEAAIIELFSGQSTYSHIRFKT